MSESYASASSNEPTADQSGKVDAAKQEASDLKDTAAGGAKQVAGTAKDEVKNLAGEAKYQAKDLYAQGKRQLADQAGTQQKRVAGGLRSVGNDLDSLASGKGASDGIASEVVKNVSKRVASAASFLENRDPADLLDDVKSYARRRPAVFIGGSLIAGILIGRLTRALAQNAADDKAADATPDYTTAPSGLGAGYGTDTTVNPPATAGVYGGAPVTGTPAYGVTDAGALNAEDTPLYTQTASFEGDLPKEGGDDVRTDRY